MRVGEPRKATIGQACGVQKATGRRTGPASLLAEGSAWLDVRPEFQGDDAAGSGSSRAAAELCQLTRALRAEQGARGLSVSELASRAGVRRQTVSDILAGITWPDAASLIFIGAALGLRLGLRPWEGEPNDSRDDR